MRALPRLVLFRKIEQDPGKPLGEGDLCGETRWWEQRQQPVQRLWGETMVVSLKNIKGRHEPYLYVTADEAEAERGGCWAFRALGSLVRAVSATPGPSRGRRPREAGHLTLCSPVIPLIPLSNKNLLCGHKSSVPGQA